MDNVIRNEVQLPLLIDQKIYKEEPGVSGKGIFFGMIALKASEGDVHSRKEVMNLNVDCHNFILSTPKSTSEQLHQLMGTQNFRGGLSSFTHIINTHIGVV